MSDAVFLTLLLMATALLGVAAVLDVAFRQIPNWLPAILALQGLLLRFLSGQFLAGLAVGAAMFIVCAIMWKRGLMGGGDVKLLAASVTVVPAAFAFSFMLSVSLAGGVLALIYATLQRVVAAPGRMRPSTLIARIVRVEQRRIRRCQSIPYACAIAAGLFLTLARG